MFLTSIVIVVTGLCVQHVLLMLFFVFVLTSMGIVIDCLYYNEFSEHCYLFVCM